MIVQVQEDGAYLVDDVYLVSGPDHWLWKHFKLESWLLANTPSYSINLANLQAKKISALKSVCGAMLQETDWYVVRKAENGESMPAAVVSYRSQIRNAMSDAENVISSLTEIGKVANYNVTWPTKPGGV